MIKATIKECREAFGAMSKVFGGVKLPRDTNWRVSRLIGLLEQQQREYQRSSSKLYMDAGAHFTGTDGFAIDAVVRRREKEKEEDFLKRQAAHSVKMNKLYEDLEKLDAREVQVNYDPIPLSWFPAAEKGEKGEDVETQYPGGVFAYLDKFTVDDVGLDSAAPEKKKGK